MAIPGSQVEGPTFGPGDEWRLKRDHSWHGIILRRMPDVDLHRGQGLQSEYEVLSYGEDEKTLYGPWYLIDPEHTCLKKVRVSDGC